jgi:Recombination endonuclease VII
MKKAYRYPEYKREWVKKNPDKVRAYKLKTLAKLRLETKNKNAAKRKWEKENPELVALQRARVRIKRMNGSINRSLNFHYDITLESYNRILIAQKEVCLICRNPNDTKSSKRLFVDHDHTAGSLRGLLCHRCNSGLGYFKDNHALIFRALSYLQFFKDCPVDQNWESKVLSFLQKHGG